MPPFGGFFLSEYFSERIENIDGFVVGVVKGADSLLATLLGVGHGTLRVVQPTVEYR